MYGLARAITPDEVAAYRSAGVVLLRQVLDLKAVNTVRRCIDEAVSSLGDSTSGYDLTELIRAHEEGDQTTIAARSGGQHNVGGLLDHIEQSGKPFLFDGTATESPGSFFVDTGVASRIKEFRRFVTRGAGAEIAGTLLQSQTVRFYGDQIFVKEPKTRERTAYHQDATYFEIEGEDCCVLWIPADPVRLEHGAMKYLRGSHRDGNLYQPNVFIAQTPLPGAEGVPLPDIEGHEDNFDIVNFDVEPGDILVHHYKIIHGTGGNTSRYQVRRAASVRYVGDDVRFKSRPFAPRQLHHRHSFVDGDLLDGPDFPVVWQRKVIPHAA